MPVNSLPVSRWLTTARWKKVLTIHSMTHNLLEVEKSFEIHPCFFLFDFMTLSIIITLFPSQQPQQQPQQQQQQQQTLISSTII
jgi:hypothetical protein